MKKLFALVLSLVMILSITACGKQDSNPSNEPSTENNVAETPTQSEPKPTEVLKFDFATGAAPGTLLAENAQYFADQVKELSGGTMEVELFLNGALGTEAQNLEALTAGTLDMAYIAIEYYSNSIPELGALILPYLYDDYDDVQATLEGPTGEYASERIREVANCVNLGYYVMMYRHMFLDRPIETAADLAGARVRVPESSLYVSTFEQLGAAPTPMSFGEIYTSCDTGVLNGYEGTPDGCITNSFYEVLDYFNLSYHLCAPSTFTMSAKVYDSLTPEQQEILMAAGAAASKKALETTKANEADYIEQLSDKMTVVETDIDSMRAAIDYNAFDFMSSPEAQKILKLAQSN